MSATVYSTTREFSNISGERMVSVDAGTGSVAIEVDHGTSNWILVETIAADTAKIVNFGYGRTVRFTVTGDATYAI